MFLEKMFCKVFDQKGKLSIFFFILYNNFKAYLAQLARASVSYAESH